MRRGSSTSRRPIPIPRTTFMRWICEPAPTPANSAALSTTALLGQGTCFRSPHPLPTLLRHPWTLTPTVEVSLKDSRAEPASPATAEAPQQQSSAPIVPGPSSWGSGLLLMHAGAGDPRGGTENHPTQSSLPPTPSWGPASLSSLHSTQTLPTRTQDPPRLAPCYGGRLESPGSSQGPICPVACP